MAGAGYKLFQTGDVLTAAQVNTYLNEQTVMVFANAAARTSALTSVLAEGMMSYLQDTNSVEVYNGSSWVNVGNAGDITEVQAGVGISVASGTGPIPVITNSSTDLITTAGDLLYGTAADTVARLGIGTAGQVLKVNSGATAPEWGAPAAPSADWVLLNAGGTTLSGVSTRTISFSAKNYLYIFIQGASCTSSGEQIQLNFNSDSGSNYDEIGLRLNAATTELVDNLNSTIARIGQMGSNAGSVINSNILVQGANGTGVKSFQLTSAANFASAVGYNYIGKYKGTSAITSVNIISNGSNFDAGTVFVYGV